MGLSLKSSARLKSDLFVTHSVSRPFARSEHPIGIIVCIVWNRFRFVCGTCLLVDEEQPFNVINFLLLPFAICLSVGLALEQLLRFQCSVSHPCR